MRRGKSQVAVLACFLTLSLAACGSSTSANQQADASSEASIQAAAQVDSQAIEKVNTLFGMSPTAEQAKEEAVAQCITARGLNWDKRPADQAYDIRSKLNPLPMSVEQAQQYGYKNPQNVEAGDFPETDEATLEAYMGNPDNGSVRVDGITGMIASDGCLAQSYKTVFGSAEAGVLFEGGIGSLPLPYLQATQMDPRIDELNAQWATCMKDQHGIDIATPDLASIDTSMDSHQLALYDAQCRQEVKYEEVITEVLNAYLTTFLADQEGVIDELTQAKQTAEKNAPAILGN